MKIAIYSDPLMGKGGGTRVVIELANRLHADIITSGFDSKLRNNLNKDVKVIDIGNLSIKSDNSFGYLFEAPIRFIFARKFNYDLNIYVGSFSIYASHKTKNNIWLCFTPNRIMYDLKDWKFRNSSAFKKIIYWFHIFLFKSYDQRAAKRNFDKIVTQTKNVQQRVKKYYGKDSEVIYSPTDTSKYKFNKLGNYYLSVSRLSPEKRMSLIAKAFVNMPDKYLVLVGNGLEKNEILKIIKNRKNIQLLSNVNDIELRKYYADCKGTIYMPIDEDFGLVPIESMASGKVCIAANEGGCKETIINGKTGFLINPTEKDLTEKINKLKDEALLKMKDDCIKRAKDFDIDVCIGKWNGVISQFRQLVKYE